MYSFSKAEIEQIKLNGLSFSDISNQLAIFYKGFNYTHLLKPAIISDGVLSLSENEIEALIEKYESQKRYYSILKFVPASGIASRMFKHLFEYLINRKKNKQIVQFIEQISSFAFFEALKNELKENIEQLLVNKNYIKILETLLKESVLNYGLMPKGLIPFHTLNKESRTAFQEHFAEGRLYASNGIDDVAIHFTILKEHHKKFKTHLEEFIEDFQTRFNTKFKVSFSYQKSSTDTIAVDSNNIPVKKINGELLFRPGGHGALIQNLNELDADIIFIKNIDNILPDNHKYDTIRYKKILAAKFMEVQSQVFHFIEKLNLEQHNAELIIKIEKFCTEILCIELADEFQKLTLRKKHNKLLNLLNRPIRVCGMVENIGESGGSPFWVKNQDGTINLQIVESGQINLSDNSQKQIMELSTHFNPVDLVCGTKNYLGELFDLSQFIDFNSSFISEKSFEGNIIKVLEHPGLWNGAMAYWNTIFVEVPISTFSPVKIANDLLRKNHCWK